jgi:ABC-type amino acid transport system permease subunit
MEGEMTGLKMRELPLRSQLALWWSFVWRGAVVTLGSTVLGGILGAVFGTVMGIVGSMHGIPTTETVRISQIGGSILGGCGGLLLSYVFLRWLLSTRLGQFRLLLVHVSELSANEAHA